MASTQRYRTGTIAEVRGAIPAAVKAEIGDLVMQEANGDIKPYSVFAGTPTTFRAKFLGVLTQGATPGTQTTPTQALVYARGEFDFDLAAPAVAAAVVGSLASAAGNQIVALGAAIADAIGVLILPVAVGDTKVKIRIQGVLTEGGIQTAVIT